MTFTALRFVASMSATMRRAFCRFSCRCFRTGSPADWCARITAGSRVGKRKFIVIPNDQERVGGKHEGAAQQGPASEPGYQRFRCVADLPAPVARAWISVSVMRMSATRSIIFRSLFVAALTCAAVLPYYLAHWLVYN